MSSHAWVSVLLAGLVEEDVMALTDRSPDQAPIILDSALELMIGEVHHHEGIVNDITGEGISALFGAPLAQEDHPLRACLAALRMRQELGELADSVRREHGVNVHVRIGVDSGDVVINLFDSTLHLDSRAVGRPATVAARPLEAADADTILVGEGTVGVVRGCATLEPAPSIERGGDAPIRVYRLLGLPGD